MVTVAQRTVSPEVGRPAGFGSRLAAYLLDGLVLFILACACVALGGLLLLVSADMGRKDPSEGAVYAALGIAGLVAPLWSVMTVLGWAWQGRSAGMLAMDLRVVSGRGRPPGIVRALLRFAVYVVENLPIAVLPAALAMIRLTSAQPLAMRLVAFNAAALALPIGSAALMCVDARRRALHDFIAGTRVIEGDGSNLG